MLGASSGVPGSSGDGGAAASGAAAQAQEGGSSSIMAGTVADEDKGVRGDEFGDRGGPAGNRWPRQETLSLLKIRSDMDAVFRDSSLKGPLWEEVSRKMAELGYHRSAKKCKEKFENVYKYHKRTKEGRAGKADGKTYRFFDQLEALENHPPALPLLPPPPLPRPQPQAAVPVSVAMPAASSTNPTTTAAPLAASVPQVTVPSATSQANAIPGGTAAMNPTNPPVPAPAPLPVSSMQTSTGVLHSHQNPIIQPSSLLSHHQVPSTPSSSPSSSSSTSSDEEILGRRKRKRKWKEFFQRLMTDVIDKQEELQRKFLEAIEKREHDRMAREDAWKLQESARLNREHEILVQERSMAAAKDTALISFLQKLSDQLQIPLPPPFSQPRPSAPPPPVPAAAQNQQAQDNPPVPLPPQPPPQPQLQLPPPPSLGNVLEGPKSNNAENLLPTSSSRWPKSEVQALINLRTNLDQKYQESGPKGPLWEEISASMRKLGYNRSSKRCKEKWENINKYFKKVKESNKKRPEDSKTCPYFQQLDQLYKEKNINSSGKMDGPFNPNYVRPAMVVAEEGGSMPAPIMAQPEQQWPLPPAGDQDPGSDFADLNEEDDDGDDDEDDDQGYVLVANNNAAASSMGGAGGGAAAATTAAMENS